MPAYYIWGYLSQADTHLEDNVRLAARRLQNYQWIIADAQLLCGKRAIRGTRLAISLILECLANGMLLEENDHSFDHAFPHPALPEVLKVASELAASFHVAA